MTSLVDEAITGLMWSLWAELGVPGWRRYHQTCAIDPEALIVFCSPLLESDARLRDEVASWCINYDRLISKTRLRNVARGQSRTVTTAFESFAAALNKKARLGWPTTHARAMPLEPRAREPDREWATRPAAVTMRLRALLGVGSRAEVARALLAYPDAALTAPELAVHIFFARRNVAEALDALEFGGLVGSVRERATVRYVLIRSTALSNLLGDVPNSFPHWPELLRFLLDLRDVLSAEKSTPLLRAVEAHRFLEAHAFAIARNRLPNPPAVKPGYEVWSQLESWATHIATAIARNDGNILKTPSIRPNFVRVRNPRIAVKGTTRRLS